MWSIRHTISRTAGRPSATAQETRLRNHTSTLAAEYAKQGKSWDNELRQRAKEVALMKQLGLATKQAKPGSAPDDDSERAEAGTE